MSTHNAKPLATVTVGAIQPDKEATRWLVRSLWPANSVGLISGAPKTFKTWFGLDLAISIASSTSCLERFPVEQPGAVLAFLAEDSLVRARERIAGIAQRRGLDLARLRFHLITEPALRLDRERDVERLDATIEAIRPRFLLLDPFVRMHAINENDAREVSAVLARLRELQRRHELAIALVHHARKNACRSPGDSLRGSGDLYAWGDTFAYMRRNAETLRLVLEHRYEQPIDPVSLHLATADDGSDPHLELSSSEPTPAEPELNEAILAALADAAAPLTRTGLRARLRVNNQRLGEALSKLAQAQLVERGPTGWALPA